MPAVFGKSFLYGGLFGIQAVSDGLPPVNVWQRPGGPFLNHVVHGHRCVDNILCLWRGLLSIPLEMVMFMNR